MERTGDVWHRTYVVRRGWRASYRLRVDGVDLPDPLNPRSWNGFSVAGTTPPSPWLAPPAAPRHKLSRHPLGWSRAGPRPAAHLRPRLRGRSADDGAP
ncbi:hypothetical protein [Nonomuraea wenchangensis]|uniref:hypothetical protein n=1 Tax=Nonomuraea wenchangensis TaxID=568860 RepID=UPI00340E7B70